MGVENILNKIAGYQQEGRKLFTTSSFQTHSIPLLHIISRARQPVPVYFLDTGYHFPQTLKFRDQVADMLGLDLRIVRSDTSRHMQKDPYGKLLFASDPDHCCTINKTQPTEALLMTHDVWINGVRRDQSPVRKDFREEEQAPHGSVRYHPILDWTSRDIYQYRKENDLPEHPLDKEGYLSIGCEPCTRKVILNDSRDARWYGMNKTECGLHTDLVKK